MPTETSCAYSKSRDFSTLRQPARNTKQKKYVTDLQNITASQLFSCTNEARKQHLRRSSSQPIMSQTNGGNNSFTRSPMRYTQENYDQAQSYGDVNYEENGSTSSIFQDGNEATPSFETMYEIIQRKLQKHMRRQEIFSADEIQKACQELRRRALVAELADGWQNSLSDLEIASGMKLEVLEAIYMLRNAHRGDLFPSQENINNNNNNRRETEVSPGKSADATPTTPTTTDVTMLPKPNRPTSLAFMRRTDSFTSSEDGTPSTPTNLSSPSSGRSTPSFRKKPRRPEIKLSEHNKQYKDYIEILRAESMQSIDSYPDEQNGDANGSIEISEELIAKAFLSSHMKSELNDSFTETLTESPHSDSLETELPCRDSLDRLKIHKLCMQRPLSPTSQFMISVLESENNDNFYSAIYDKVSPVLNKLKNYDEQSSQLSSLQVKIAVLQEEKRQLATLLREKREESALNAKNKRDVAVQKHLEIITEICHTATQTARPPAVRSLRVGGDEPAEVFTCEKSVQQLLSTNESSCQHQTIPTFDCSTETNPLSVTDCATDPMPNHIGSTSKACQQTPSGCNIQTQTVEKSHVDIAVMVGSPTNNLVDASVGKDQDAFKVCHVGMQASGPLTSAIATQSESVSSLSTGVQVSREHQDFACGENIACLEMVDKAVIPCLPEYKDSCVNTTDVDNCEVSIQCETVALTSVAIGDGNVFDILCDRCNNLEMQDAGSGCQVTDDTPCCIDDKLCECIKPETATKGVGEHTITDNLCDRCDNVQTRTIAVSEDTISDLLCDKCTNLRQHDVSVGGDYDVNNIICDSCNNKPKTVSVAIGDGDVTNDKCENCKNNNNRDSTIFNFDFNIAAMDNGHIHQQPIICHYCGNKVDLNDDSVDETLQAMRDSMQSLAEQQGSLKRTGARKQLNLEFPEDYRSGTMYSSKDSGLVTPNSDDNYTTAIASDDDDNEDNTSHDDVIQACKMLHNHFSGEKPLKQQQMMKYMAVIQALWFKTVKRRRANASVVKSYIDLFHQRIPELLETIINLSDDEGNTALHFAMTYKNIDVASILLDSGECCADLVNQAGYSPLMLAAFVGFERKNDKYVMQRLVRLGDINKESSDAGQTPVMLAVSHGNANMVDLLLDAGCNINAVDDEGSTALMCACEHGNASIVKMLLANPDCDATVEDNEGSTALSIAMDSRRKDLALLIYGSLNFDARGRIKLSPSKQSLLGLGRRSPSPVIGRR